MNAATCAPTSASRTTCCEGDHGRVNSDAFRPERRIQSDYRIRLAVSMCDSANSIARGGRGLASPVPAFGIRQDNYRSIRHRPPLALHLRKKLADVRFGNIRFPAW